MRTIAVVNVARSDFSILRPVMKAIAEDPALDLRTIVAGMHLSPEFGYSAQSIIDDGFEIHERVEMTLSSDTPEAIAKSVGLGTIGFAQVLSRSTPDVMVLMGDRFEFLAAASAALPFRVPIAHIHGGELSEGAIDDSIRHAITKLSHLHFVATEEFRRRVIQLGEAPWRVTVSGAPGLDNLPGLSQISRQDLAELVGLPLEEAPLLATFHPETHSPSETAANLDAMLEAMAEADRPILFSYPNADTAGRRLIAAIEQFCANHDGRHVVPNLGVAPYYNLLSIAAAMVGNSSSGIIEAASFGLPVVNIGNRQQRRPTGRNVIHAPAKPDAIRRALAQATSPEFRASLDGLTNPYGDGHAAERIVARLCQVDLDETLIVKRFQDIDTCKPSLTKSSVAA